MSAIVGRVHGNSDARVLLEVGHTPACVVLRVFADGQPDARFVLSHDAALDLSVELLEAARAMRLAARGGGK